MNETARELDLIRTQLRAAIERDLHGRSRRSRFAHRRSFRIALPTLALLAAAEALDGGAALSVKPRTTAAVAASALFAAAEALDGGAALRVKPRTMAPVTAASSASVGIAIRNDRRCVTRGRGLRPCKSRSIAVRS